MDSKPKRTLAKFSTAHLERDTLQEQVYRQLSNLILDGDIEPGSLVTIQALAESLGVSTMPVREAFKRLTAANALTVVSGRSIGIPPLSVERLTDLRNVRIELEGVVTEWAVDKFTETGIARLEAAHDAMRTAAAERDVKGFLRANRAFHFEIYRTAESSAALGLIENLWLQISPFFSLLHESGNQQSANRQHEALIRAVKAGDKTAARQAICEDINGAYRVLLDLLQE